MLLVVHLKHAINNPIPPAKILEYLTVASSQETFFYEMEEFLGDACLKWVIVICLFLKYNQGQLTYMRQQILSNVFMYQYALDKGL